MRRLIGFTVLVIALAVPAVAFAISTLGDDGSLSVKNGVGKVVLQPFNGSVLGRVVTGRVVIVDQSLGGGSGSGSLDVWGCDNPRPTATDRVTVCSGSNLRFRVVDSRYKIVVRGSGINLSAVGRGTVTLDGSGEDPGVQTDGQYSLNDGAYKSLPNVEKPFSLVAPGS
jgi:hypothetical protein